MIILNEREFAEECIRNKKMPDKPYRVLSIIAKYYYQVHGYKGKQLAAQLIQFFKDSNNATFSKNIDYWESIVETIVRKAVKYPLSEIDGVWVTHKELDKIAELEDDVLERLAFTLLCLAKLGNLRRPTNNSWVNDDEIEFFRLARVTIPSLSRDRKIHALYKRGYLGFAKQVDNLSLRVLYIDTETTEYSRKNGDVFVDDFRELGYLYRQIKGMNYTRCHECGVLFKNNKNGTRKYCTECQKYVPQDTKTIVCIDCGKDFQVDGSNKRTVRCPDCQAEHRRELDRNRKKKCS